MVLCYFAFPPQRHEESSEKIRLQKWFLCFLSFPLRLTKERSPAKYPVKNKGGIKKEVRADRYPSRTSGDETQGGDVMA